MTSQWNELDGRPFDAAISKPRVNFIWPLKTRDELGTPFFYLPYFYPFMVFFFRPKINKFYEILGKNVELGGSYDDENPPPNSIAIISVRMFVSISWRKIIRDKFAALRHPHGHLTSSREIKNKTRKKNTTVAVFIPTKTTEEWKKKGQNNTNRLKPKRSLVGISARRR